jgi:ketosteroid isomerase-like protein
MKIELRLSPIVACLISALASAEDARTPEDVLNQWAKAFGSAKVTSMADFYEDSKDVVVILSSGSMVKGGAAVQRVYEEAFEEVAFESVALDSLRVRQAGDVAWATCRFKADTLRHSDKSRWKLDIYTTFVLKRSGGSWKIALEHSSPIADVPRVQRRK